MAHVPELTQDEKKQLLSDHPQWELAREGKAIMRTLQFGDFSEAWGFMNRVALLAETHDHHPEWFNIYNRVDVTLTTHDADNSVSEKDIKMAELMNKYAE